MPQSHAYPTGVAQTRSTDALPQPFRTPPDGGTRGTPLEQLDYVVAEVNHLTPTEQKPTIHVVPPSTGEPRRVSQYEQHAVRIHDVRPIAGELSLDRQGMALVSHETAVTDFYDEEEVRRIYYPEVERLVQQATGASRVVVFDHTTRTDRGPNGDETPAPSQHDGASRTPVRTVHNDYTLKSGPQRVRDLLEAEDAEQALKGRFAVINVWRPIRGPVETAPLAVADARYMEAEDFVAADLIYPDRVGEVYDVTFNPEHRWYYVPKMQRNEAILLKCYDSAEDGRARFTAHSAFDDPTAPQDALPRESIEIRTLVFFPTE